MRDSVLCQLLDILGDHEISSTEIGVRFGGVRDRQGASCREARCKVPVAPCCLYDREGIIKDLVGYVDLFDDGFEAIFIGTGAGLPWFMGIPGENFNGVYSANEFLTRVNLMRANRFPDYPTPIKVGKISVVVGGGNTAMDAARVSKRIGYKEVYIVYRRTEAEMPARKAEYEHAIEEGIKFMFLHSPIEIHGKDGYVNGLTLQVMELGEPDASGRRRPVCVEGKTVHLDADTVIMAIGTSPNPVLTKSAKADNIPIDVDKKGYIVTSPETGATTLKGVYAGGDISPILESNVINAMGAGKKAVHSINEYLKSLVKV